MPLFTRGEVLGFGLDIKNHLEHEGQSIEFACQRLLHQLSLNTASWLAGAGTKY